jgi:hypothetical protein
VTRQTLSRLARAGILTGVTDGLFSSVLSVAFYHSTVTRLFQGVASVLIGPEALTGGTRTAAIGLLMHFGVAFGWSVMFLVLAMNSAWLRTLLGRRYGVVTAASVYGPFVWIAMSLAVIPLIVHRPPTFNIRWWVQVVGHGPFVGLPIAASLAPAVRPRLDRGIK